MEGERREKGEDTDKEGNDDGARALGRGGVLGGGDPSDVLLCVAAAGGAVDCQEVVGGRFGHS